MPQCSICLTADDAPLDCATCPNGHFCQSCFKQHVAFQVSQGKWRIFMPCCNAEASEVLLEPFLAADQREKRDYWMVSAALAGEENVQWCPTDGCRTPMIGCPRTHTATCPKCTKTLCFGCGKPSHGFWLWSPCNSSQEALFWAWARMQGTRRCPRCRFVVDRTDGCNHMNCSRCAAQFCYGCGCLQNACTCGRRIELPTITFELSLRKTAYRTLPKSVFRKFFSLHKDEMTMEEWHAWCLERLEESLAEQDAQRKSSTATAQVEAVEVGAGAL